MPSEPYPPCKGLLSADGQSCCGGECGACGGEGCSSRLGGAEQCCPGWGEFELSAADCQLSAGEPPCIVEDLAAVQCPRGFTLGQKPTCYRLFGGVDASSGLGGGKGRLAHAAASAFCRSHFAASLAKLGDRAENDEVAAMCDKSGVAEGSSSGCWVGASNSG